VVVGCDTGVVDVGSDVALVSQALGSDSSHMSCSGVNGEQKQDSTAAQYLVDGLWWNARPSCYGQERTHVVRQ
jgi:hypothetical protein